MSWKYLGPIKIVFPHIRTVKKTSFHTRCTVRYYSKEIFRYYQIFEDKRKRDKEGGGHPVYIQAHRGHWGPAWWLRGLDTTSTGGFIRVISWWFPLSALHVLHFCLYSRVFVCRVVVGDPNTHRSTLACDLAYVRPTQHIPWRFRRVFPVLWSLRALCMTFLRIHTETIKLTEESAKHLPALRIRWFLHVYIWAHSDFEAIQQWKIRDFSA